MRNSTQKLTITQRVSKWFEAYNRKLHRAAAISELENIYASRKYFDKREIELTRHIKQIDLINCMSSINRT